MVCVAVRDETPSVRTFRLRPAKGRVPFIPGQALQIGLPLTSGAAWRSFTISGAAGADLELTVKAQGSEGATGWMHAHLREGVAIEARAPRGAFTLARRRSDRIALVSGGSGATPMIAMLRHLAETQPDADVVWFHAAHEPAEVLFARELSALQDVMSNLSVAICVSRVAPGWFGYRGRISRPGMVAAVPDLGRREVFCCGPQGFMREVRLIHAAEGGDRTQFHTESFGAAAEPASQADAAPTDGAAFSLTVNGRTIAIHGEETILQAGLRQGVIIPSGCGEGMCGTCMVRRVSGEIACLPHGGLTPDEAAGGFVLACSSRARSDVEISMG